MESLGYLWILRIPMVPVESKGYLWIPMILLISTHSYGYRWVLKILMIPLDSMGNFHSLWAFEQPLGSASRGLQYVGVDPVSGPELLQMDLQADKT